MKKYLALALAVLMLVAAFAGCGKEETKVYGTFRSYFTSAPTTLSCLATQDTNPWTLIDLTTVGLYRSVLNKEKTGWEWATDLAAKFPEQVDKDGYVWQYTIVKDAVWSNGDKITVDDFEFTFKAYADPVMMHPQNGTQTRNSYGVLTNIYEYHMGEKEWADVGYKKIDDYTFQATFTTTCTLDDALRALNRNIINKTAYEAGMNEDGTGTQYGSSLDYYASCGAFVLTEWIPDGKYVLTRNPDYVHADEIKLESIVYTVVPDTNTALQLFENGELDYVSIGYTQWEKYEDDPRIYEYFNDSLMYFMINHGNPSYNNILGNLNFRKALYYGIDRKEMSEIIGCYPATRLIRRAVISNPATGVPFYTLENDYVDDGYTVFNKTLANEYLDKAYEETKNTTVDMRILFSETSTHLRGCAEVLQRQYGDYFGGKLNAIMHTMPSAQAQALRKWNPDDPTGFDTALGSFLPTANDPRQTFKFYLSSVQPPRFYWTSDKLDQLFDQAMALDLEKDNAKVIELCMEMEKLMLDEMVIVPVYEIPTKVLYESNIELPAGGYIIGWGFGNMYMTMTEK